MNVTRTFDLLERYRTNFSKPDALVSKKEGDWVKVSSQEYFDHSHYVAYGLLAKGFKKGDKVATISTNCPEWNIVDMGLAMAGIVHVPIFNTLNADEYAYIFDHAEIKAVFVSDFCTYEMIEPAVKQVKNVEFIYSFNKGSDAADWLEIIELGKQNESKFKQELEDIKDSIKPNDFATLIYTSGTTGKAKGVMLSHNNMVQNFLAASAIFNLKDDERYLSILPLCHVGGRLGNYQTQYSGTSIYYAENMGSIAKNMKEIQAAGFDAVPRILEKIFDTIVGKGKNLKGMKKKIFFWAVKTGLNYRISGFGLPFYKLKLKIADKLVFSKWREAIGGKVRLVGCGGASLQARIERVFWASGIKILNMYGLTETSPIITINRTHKPHLKLGSIGSVIDGVDVKIADDGEILCKGHNVMLGYYKDPEMTKSVFDQDGWFCTGDIGYLEKDDFLYVTDRKKEIFKLSNGKFVSPQLIEGKIKESLFVDQVMVVGEHEKFASALISPDFNFITNWCKEQNIEFSTRDEIVKQPLLLEILNSEMKQLNASLNGPEKILRFRLVTDEWTPNSGELSPTLKLKRKIISDKYQETISEIYVKQSI
ncbi:MAG: long-chain fatty acid--CoA ligase [Bacteroidetes bacterium]|nr:long-chain fatty acid--CoA ligase [Bacteroidota bacterium]MBT4339837.1 long-chain fatty acid--CoA ligase [Bacteroidota bacterium]MBT4728337.1 long-chain fatty acid--CoA ligase [Bacteroidota bacterium]MBT5529997.1 long-chain fatty acid--CoA ligase [Cytophagia bacterium]MBT7825113.1 long-chain fatty acid--CoA ligase [Bacteroidota bacterium]